MLSLTGSTMAFDPRAPLTVHDVGEYAAVPWGKPGEPVEPGSREDRVRDLTFTVGKAVVGDDYSEASIRYWADTIRDGCEQGKKLLLYIDFWDGVDRYDGPLRDIEVYWARLDRLLDGLPVQDLHGITLAEENVHYAGRPQVLTELYRRVKAKFDVAVWQWYSPVQAVPGSGGWIPADGWVIDPYMLGGDAYRQYVRKYVIAGKPVIIMPWASVMGGSSDQRYFDLADDQLRTAVEFGLPVAFFWCSGTTCYFGADRQANETLMDRNNQRVWRYIERVRGLSADFHGHPSADFAQRPPVALEVGEDGAYHYDDSFASSKCVDDASMSGFRDLVMDGKGLHLRGFRGRRPEATLTYRFAPERPLRDPEVRCEATTNAALGGRVRVKLSADGRQWQSGAGDVLRANGDFARLWVRLELSADQPGFDAAPSLSLKRFAVTATVRE